MNVTVITGTDVRGCTYRLKEAFLEPLRGRHDITEFTLPRQAPPYCTGCKRCFNTSMEDCPHFDRTEPIWRAMSAADVIVFAFPSYVSGPPAQVKALLDHLACHWIPHRPQPEMFTKRVAIVCQSIGAPTRSAVAAVKRPMHWMGVSSVRATQLKLLGDVRWNTLPQARRDKMEAKVRKLARWATSGKPVRKSPRVRAIFELGRFTQRILRQQGWRTADIAHWEHHGWL